MKFYNAKNEEINLINYTKENQDTPYNAEWTVREESYSNTKKVQWATKSDDIETYKRSFNDGVWSDWLLVEGRCELWSGSLPNGQSITIPRLNQFNRFEVHVENTGNITCQREHQAINGVTFWKSGNNNFLSVVDLITNNNTITNDACGYVEFSKLSSANFTLNVIRIVGIP